MPLCVMLFFYLHVSTVRSLVSLAFTWPSITRADNINLVISLPYET